MSVSSLVKRVCIRCSPEAEVIFDATRCIHCGYDPQRKKPTKPKGLRSAATSFALRRKSLLDGISRVQDAAGDQLGALNAAAHGDFKGAWQLLKSSAGE
jgi:ribosomal protein L40E